MWEINKLWKLWKQTYTSSHIEIATSSRISCFLLMPPLSLNFGHTKVTYTSDFEKVWYMHSHEVKYMSCQFSKCLENNLTGKGLKLKEVFNAFKWSSSYFFIFVPLSYFTNISTKHLCNFTYFVQWFNNTVDLHKCTCIISVCSLCLGHSWQVWVTNQQTQTPPRHLVSPLV